MEEGPHPSNMQFEYAWRWFDLHAKQRVSMFNFFLISVGALATAYGLLLREQLYVVAAVAAFLGVLVSLVSCLLDVRNRQLVKMGEEALKEVEKAHLTECQILTDEKQPPSLLKHGSLIKLLEIVVAIVYFAGMVYSVILGTGMFDLTTSENLSRPRHDFRPLW